jgi:hypothetical protein
MTNPLSKVVSITSARLLELGPSRSAASSAAGWLYRGGHARLRRGAAVDMVVSFSCYFQVQPKRTPRDTPSTFVRFSTPAYHSGYPLTAASILK